MSASSLFYDVMSTERVRFRVVLFWLPVGSTRSVSRGGCVCWVERRGRGGPVKPSMATAAEAFGTRLGSCDATRGTMRCSDCGWAQQKPRVVTSDVTREFP